MNKYEVKTKQLSDYLYSAIGDISDNTILYHYTDINGLNGIIKNKEFWLTQREYMNDIAEPNYARSIIKEVLVEVKNKIENDFDIDEIIERYHFYRKEYIFSLSLEEDSIHQWNYYSKGKGYCISFKKGDIYNCLRESAKENSFGPVIYSRNIQKEAVKKLLSIIETKNKTSKLYCEYSNSVEQWLMTFYGLFKQENHSCEREVRIIANNAIQPTKYRIKNDIYIPYIELKYIKSPIFEIWVGPNLEKGIAEEGLKGFLLENNISVKIRESQIHIR